MTHPIWRKKSDFGDDINKECLARKNNPFGVFCE